MTSDSSPGGTIVEYDFTVMDESADEFLLLITSGPKERMKVAVPKVDSLEVGDDFRAKLVSEDRKDTAWRIKEVVEHGG